MQFPLDYYSYQNIPIDRDIYIISEKDYSDFIIFCRYFLDDEDPHTPHPNGVVGSIRAAVRKITVNYLVVEIFLDTSFRFHSTVITLPKSKFRYCLANHNFQKQAVLIVSDDWVSSALYSNYSSFCMIDAIGVKNTILKDGAIDQGTIRMFTSEINKLSRRYRNYTFFSFGDSVVVKGTFKGDRRYFYTFKPEELIQIANEVMKLFIKIFDYASYAVFTQGLLYDYDKKSIKKSFLGNHYSLGSLGTPFAEIFEIDETARKNIKSKVHLPCDFYMTDYFFHALERNYDDKTEFSKYTYSSKMSFLGVSSYYALNIEDIDRAILTKPLKEKIRLMKNRFKYSAEVMLNRNLRRAKVLKYYAKEDLDKMLECGPVNEITD